MGLLCSNQAHISLALLWIYCEVFLPLWSTAPSPFQALDFLYLLGQGLSSVERTVLEGGGQPERGLRQPSFEAPGHNALWNRSGIEGAYGGALSAVRAQCNYLGVWPY